MNVTCTHFYGLWVSGDVNLYGFTCCLLVDVWQQEQLDTPHSLPVYIILSVYICSSPDSPLAVNTPHSSDVLPGNVKLSLPCGTKQEVDLANRK